MGLEGDGKVQIPECGEGSDGGVECALSRGHCRASVLKGQGAQVEQADEDGAEILRGGCGDRRFQTMGRYTGGGVWVPALHLLTSKIQVRRLLLVICDEEVGRP